MRQPFTTCALLLGTAVAHPAIANAQVVDPNGISSVTPAPGQQRTTFWTNQRLRQAEPLALPMVDPEAVKAAARIKENPTATPGTNEAQHASTDQKQSGNVRSRPLYWAGKLWFRKTDGKSFSCSAQFISSRVLLTAAHCVRDAETGRFYTDFAFYLQYENGSYAKAYNAYVCAATMDGWLRPSPGNHAYDYATILLTADSPTGYFGTRWNYGSVAYPIGVKIGYPSGNYDGKIIQVEGGTLTVTDGIVRMVHGNPADQRGSSGGAWIVEYRDGAGAGNYIISVESFSYPSQPGVDYGPYLDASFKKLWDYTENRCRNP